MYHIVKSSLKSCLVICSACLFYSGAFAQSSAPNYEFLNGTWGDAERTYDGKFVKSEGWFDTPCGENLDNNMRIRVEGEKIHVSLLALGKDSFFGKRVEGFARNVKPWALGGVEFEVPEYSPKAFIFVPVKDGVIAQKKELDLSSGQTSIVDSYFQKCT